MHSWMSKRSKTYVNKSRKLPDEHDYRTFGQHIFCMVLVSFGAVGMYAHMNGKQIESCWGTFADVYWESLHQESLPNEQKWNISDPTLAMADLCVLADGSKYNWRRVTRDEAMARYMNEQKEENGE
jgi:hypothetical protein